MFKATAMRRKLIVKCMTEHSCFTTSLALSMILSNFNYQVTRYQSDPGQATAYMIGQLEIKKARKYSEDNLGDKFSLRDFHYQVICPRAIAVRPSGMCERKRIEM